MRTCLFDASQWLLYFPDRLDSRKSLWFMRDLLDLDAWKDNAVALVSGADFESFRECEPFFSAFPSIFLAIADKGLANDVSDALREAGIMVPILTPRRGAFGQAKSVREVYLSGGEKAVSRLMMGAEERSPGGLLDLSDVVRMDTMSQPFALSGIPALDATIGGFFPSELSVWTGKRGSGKSTLLCQTLLGSIEQGHHVCAYSGELSSWRFKEWAILQAAGPDHVVEKTSSSGRRSYTVERDIERRIDSWWKGKFFLYDNRVAAASDENSILSVFEYAARRYGCAVFLVDNLMSARFSTSADRDYYRAQSNFVGRLVEFAKKYEVHVHLVAHPRKTEKIIDADEVGGSGDITNRADNVFSLDRLDEQKAAEKGCDAVLKILKNRSFGETAQIGLYFDDRCRRYSKPGTKPQKYGWEYTKKPEFKEVAADGREPF